MKKKSPTVRDIVDDNNHEVLILFFKKMGGEGGVFFIPRFSAFFVHIFVQFQLLFVMTIRQGRQI